MKRIGLMAALSISVFVTSCKKEQKETDVVKETVEVMEKGLTAQSKKLTMKLAPKSDSKAAGSVFFKEVDGTVTMTAVLGGLSEGTHAIHIHEKADCSSADGKSSGGHWNPTAQPHGKWGDVAGYHKGDIGNFEADENGNGTITFITNTWCIGCDDPNKDITGKAIIVHQGTDDFTSQPSGAAGARISCGGIIE